MIELRSISHAYGASPVLREVDLTIDHGCVFGVVGPNGSGKTTMLRILNAALRPSTGRVLVDGRAIADLPVAEVARTLAAVVQESGSESTLTAAEMVLLGRAPHLRSFQSYGVDDRRIAAEALDAVNARHLATRSCASLSGGERQRVLIARALAQQAPYLLLDEPTNHLDVRHQHELLSLVRALDVAAVVVVLHDLNLALRYCDAVALLDAGRVVASGPVDTVLTSSLLTPTYDVDVHRVVVDGEPHLIFRPKIPTTTGDTPA